MSVLSTSVIGADVHSKVIVCCARYLVGNEWVEKIESFGTTKNELLRMAEWCSPFNPDFVLMESTGVYWMSPLKYLERAGLVVKIVNPRSIKRMVGKKTDKLDAQWLAEKGNDGSFIPSYIPTEHWRNLRAKLRNIFTQEKHLTSLKNRETKMFLSMGYRLNSVFSDTFGLNASRAKDAILENKSAEEVYACIDTRCTRRHPKEEFLEAFSGDLTKEHVEVIMSNRKVMEVLLPEIAKAKQEIISAARQQEEQIFALLQTIPGIDEFHAAALVIEYGGHAFTEAFSSDEKFASWLGICPGVKESGAKRSPCKSGHGNWAARRCLCEAAHSAARTNDSTIQSRYRAQCSRIGKKKAVISAAHYIAGLTYTVAKNQRAYIDPQVDYVAAAFNKNFKRYVQQALRYRDTWEVNVENKETGETYTTPHAPSSREASTSAEATTPTGNATNQADQSSAATATSGRRSSRRRATTNSTATSSTATPTAAQETTDQSSAATVASNRRSSRRRDRTRDYVVLSLLSFLLVFLICPLEDATAGSTPDPHSTASSRITVGRKVESTPAVLGEKVLQQSIFGVNTEICDRLNAADPSGHGRCAKDVTKRFQRIAERPIREIKPIGS